MGFDRLATPGVLLATVPARRRRQDDLEGNPSGERVLAAVREQPGVQFLELLRTAGVANGTLAYHLHRLEGNGLIGSRIVNGRKHYFAYGARGQQEASLLSSRKREFLELLQQNPGLTEVEVSRLLGVEPEAASYHLRGLLLLRLVRSERDGHSLRWYPSVESRNF